MKTPTGLTAAFILASAVIAAPAAFADSPREPVEARFHYNPKAQATAVYKDLSRTARQACEASGTRSLATRKLEQSCVMEMIDDGIAKLGRADVAAVHNGFFATADAGTRG